jgi:heme-NO-binding protein
VHGIIFGEMKRLAESRLGKDSWRPLLDQAGLGSHLYMPVGEYPDEEAGAIVQAIAHETGKEIKEVHEELGEFLVPRLISLYHFLIKPEWKLLDLLEHTEQTIHRVVRTRSPGAKPPELKTQRRGDEVLITYASQRRMCGVAIGIVRGLARYFHEAIQIQELSCMSSGSAACRISVRTTTPLPGKTV